jgi:hypothetical protein
MPDFSWTQQHDLIPSRKAVQTAFEQVGFQFTAGAETLTPDQRPRAIGETSDRRARIELIGPDDVVFKATILVQVADVANGAGSQADLLHFLTVLVPEWKEGSSWLMTHFATIDQAATTTRYRDLSITLRTGRNGKQVSLGVTWQPQER